MNTLTVSIVLLVAATIAGVAIVNLIQAMRSRGARRESDTAPTANKTPVRAAGRETRYEPVLANPERSDPTMPASQQSPAPSTGAAARADQDIDDIFFATTDPPSTASSTGSHAASPAGSPAASLAGDRPTLGATTAASPAGESLASTASATATAAVPAVPVAYRAAAVALDPRVDCIVEFTLASPWTGQRLLQLAQANRRTGSKPVLFEAFCKQDGTGIGANVGLTRADKDMSQSGVPLVAAVAANKWDVVRAEQSYRQVRAGVLLANRHGPLNAMEFAEFLSMTQRLADVFDALPVLPDMTVTLQQARLLDAECIKLDAQLGINIDCADAIGTADLARIARENALAERGNNRYARLGSGDEVLFSLALSDKPNRVTLLLDVPRAPVDQQPWPALRACADACRAPLQGHIVDDAGRPLNSRNLDSLSADLAQRYAMLDQSGFKAGSALALRVFN